MSELTDESLVIKPLTLSKWDDFEVLFREHGPQKRLLVHVLEDRHGRKCQRGYGEGNRLALRAIVAGGKVARHPPPTRKAGRSPGARSARERITPVLDRSRTLKRVDDRPVWSNSPASSCPSP